MDVPIAFRKASARWLAISTWAVVLIVAAYIFWFRGPEAYSFAKSLMQTSPLVAGTIFFIFGCLRGFTLIPSTYFILLGLLFFPPFPLYLMVVFSIVISSALIYWFSDAVHMDSYFESKYPKEIERIKAALSKREMSLIIGWSFAPFLPTDLICYVCGALELDFKKFILSVFIGEALSCLMYIYFGGKLFEFCHTVTWCPTF